MVKDCSDNGKKFAAITWWATLISPYHRQDSTYHNLCYINCGALAGTRNGLMSPPWDPTTHCSLSRCPLRAILTPDIGIETFSVPRCEISWYFANVNRTDVFINEGKLDDFKETDSKMEK